MSEAFDPYHRWLGISPKDQPPNHYRLLGIDLFESNPDVIADAADRQMAHVRTHQTGKHSKLSQELLNEISAARVCLLNPEKKAEYDKSLRMKVTPTVAPVRQPPSKRSWQTPALVAGAVVVALVIVVVLMANKGEAPQTSKKPVAVLPKPLSEKTVVPSPPPEPPSPVELEAKVEPEPEPEPKPNPPPTETTETGNTEPEMLHEQPKPVLSQDTQGPTVPSLPPDAEEQLKKQLAEAKTGQDYRAVAEQALRFVDQAIVADNADAAKQLVILVVAAAREAKDDELSKMATLRYLELQGVLPESVSRTRWSDSVFDKKPPSPSDAAQEQALTLIKEVYAKDWDAAKTLAQKQALAEKLLQKANESTDDTNRYVLLKIARDVAAQAGDVKLAFKAINEMAGRYDVDSYKLKGAALSQAAKSATLQKHRSAIAKHALELIDEAVEKDDFVAAKYLGKLALGAARKGRDGQLIKRVVARNKEVEEVAKAYSDIEDALATLKSSPVDPEVNLAVGKYHCFIKGNWDRGLPMLALGSDEELNKLAVKELGDVSAADEQVALADSWWDLASSNDGTAKQQLGGRASHWYRKALPGLGGLVKGKVEKRLDEVGLPQERRAEARLKQIQPVLLSVRRIWSSDKFNAYTDLLYFEDRWFCVFREGKDPFSADGVIRVIQSKDGGSWQSSGVLEFGGFDLRDPKLCVTPDSQLMLSCPATKRHGKKTIDAKGVAFFSSDGSTWSRPRIIVDDDYVLWRCTWNEDTCYGIGYSVNPLGKLRLYKSDDGKDFHVSSPTLYTANLPSETVLVFDKDGSALCVIRCNGGDKRAILGEASKPYLNWRWRQLDRSIAGPDLARLPDDRLIVAGRLYTPSIHTGVCFLDRQKGKMTEFISLPSGKQTGYPGLVFRDKHLWVTYYSSHESGVAIYLAKVQLYE